MEEDRELERIKRQKLQKYAEKIHREEREQEKRTPTADVDSEVYSYLYDRAPEVMRAAESQFPEQTEAIKQGLHKMIKTGRLTEKIDGGTLLTLFRTLGLPVHVDTSIKFVEHGEARSLAEKLSSSWSDQ